jgi:hypothetical protein
VVTPSTALAPTSAADCNECKESLQGPDPTLCYQCDALLHGPDPHDVLCDELGDGYYSDEMQDAEDEYIPSPPEYDTIRERVQAEAAYKK